MPYSPHALHASTPEVAVIGTSGLVRALRFLRSPGEEGSPARLLVSRTVTDIPGRTVRLYGARPLAGGAADAITVSGPVGQPLLLHTADGDATLTLSDAADRPLWTRNAQDSVIAVAYESARHGGRPAFLTETVAGGTRRVQEQFLYAMLTDTDAQAHNLSGALITHHDNAGYTNTFSASVSGQPLETAQHLLPHEAGLPDWETGIPPDTEPPLTITATYDATGVPLMQTNSAGVTTVTRYDIRGSVEDVRLHYEKNGAPQEIAILSHILRTPEGLMLSQTAGNGVVETCDYDRLTHRLTRHTMTRPVGHPQGALLISDLHYAYDPMGNILTLNEVATDTQWHRNQTIRGERHYTYDTLCRLVTSTGRERLADTATGPQTRLNTDGTGTNREWSPYSESYTYDDGDNLIKTIHSGRSGWTRELVVSTASNRALPRDHALTPETGFLPGGLQTQLSDGRRLDWYADGHLRRVSPVIRDSGVSDTETYHYSDGGTRVRKVSTVAVSGGMHKHITTYAGGGEKRQRHNTAGALTLEVLITESGGVRLIDNRLTGEVQLRYGFSDHLGSSSGETDGDGNITSREEYYPYGGSAGSDEEAEESYDRTRRYSGKEQDATGLFYYGWRYYQPETGRWLSADPGGLIDGVNLFRFCRGNPVNGFDTDGRKPTSTKDWLKKSYKHAKENLNKKIQPDETQHDFDHYTMPFLVEKENLRKGKNNNSAPGSIKYFNNVEEFSRNLRGNAEDRKVGEEIHYQAVVRMMPQKIIAPGHYTVFDVYKPAQSSRQSLINIESAYGFKLDEDGDAVGNLPGGVGEGFNDLSNVVDAVFSDEHYKNKAPSVLVFETKAQKSPSDCAIFSISNARALAENKEKVINIHSDFRANSTPSNEGLMTITIGREEELKNISMKFFKYAHSNSLLEKIEGTSGSIQVRNNNKKLRIFRNDRYMNIGVEHKRLMFLKHARN